MTTKDNLLQPTVLATAPSRKTLCGVPASSSRPAKPLVPSWLKKLMCLYGIILGETPSPRYALRILHAQAALLMFLFPFTPDLQCASFCSSGLSWRCCNAVATSESNLNF